MPTPTADEPSVRATSTSWVHLIKRVYEVDPLTCTACGGAMRIVNLYLPTPKEPQPTAIPSTATVFGLLVLIVEVIRHATTGSDRGAAGSNRAIWGKSGLKPQPKGRGLKENHVDATASNLGRLVLGLMKLYHPQSVVAVLRR